MAPHWAALAAAEYLAGVWFDEISEQQAWELSTAAFRGALGWGTGGKSGLKKYKGFRSASSFGHAVVKRFELKDQQKRANLRGNKVLPHCKKELIVLHDGETLLECAGRLADWAGEDLVVVAVHEVSSLRLLSLCSLSLCSLSLYSLSLYSLSLRSLSLRSLSLC
jgi:hypothetical protein